MAGISTSIELQDHFSSVLNNVCNAVNLAINFMTDMQSTIAADVDTSSLEGAREQINLATLAIHEMNEAMQNTGTPRIEPPPTPAPSPTPAPPPVPVQWQSDSLPVFDGSGMERFRQEVQSVDTMLQQLCRTQDTIANQALHTNVLPPEAFGNINNLAVRMDSLRNRIQAISENPVNMGTEQANTQLEQLRAQLNAAIRQQEELNEAMASGDINAINNAYLQLSQTIGNTERYIRDNTDEQGKFNRQVQEGTSALGGLLNSIKGIAAEYVSIQGIKNVLNLSEQMRSSNARLNMMNDGLQTTQELQNMIYLSAERSREAYQSTADAVSKLGLMAGDAFGSSEEIIGFVEQINKQFSIAGTEASEIEAAMLHLTQVMSSGVLQVEEYNNIMEQAPNIIQAIADYMEVPKGQLEDMAAEGQITADIVKAAMFEVADETNAKFESMPMTWGQLWQSFQNSALMAFQPVLQRLNEIANNEAFSSLVNTAIEGITRLANSEALQMFIGKVEQMINILNSSGVFQGVVIGVVIAFEMLINIVTVVIDLLGSAAGFIAENWSVIAPIIGGVVAILATYALYLGIVKGIEIASTVASGAMAIAKGIQATAIWLTTSATWAETTAQLGLNGAMYACPVVWIVGMLIALIAVIIAVANHIAKTSEVANTGFSVITGGINVVIQFFKNLALTVANIALGIGAAIGALANNIRVAFHNALSSVRAWWYDLLSDAMFVIEKICVALNQLPFVEFDYSGITAAASDYAAKAAAAASDKWEYTSVADAFQNASNKYNTFQDGWAQDAYNEGAEWGNGITDMISDLFNKTNSAGEQQNAIGTYTEDDAASQAANAGQTAANTGQTAANTGQTADNTAKIADALDISNQELKYLRDIAERKAVNRYATTNIKIEMTNNNNVSSDTDLDGFVNGLTAAVSDAMMKSAEGVHI